MDIYVVLPEDQVKEHARLFRMILVLIIGALVQADPQDLPKKPLQFLLEEVAQLGASPDIETGVKLIHTNEISAMPDDEQFIFYDKKNIRCKKVRYFENKRFAGMYDPNPLDERPLYSETIFKVTYWVMKLDTNIF